jgi:tetratricopeptide (TPR) repeat protein
MQHDEAKALLESTRNGAITEAEESAAQALLLELGCLPLAVSQAGTYLLKTSMPIDQYLSKIQSGKTRWGVLGKSGSDRHRRPWVPNSVLETWQISIDKIEQESQVAYEILHTLVYVDNQRIPLELIKGVAERGRGEDEAVDTPQDEGKVDDQDEEGETDEDVTAAICRLQDFSFIRAHQAGSEGPAYEMHPLVQEAIRYTLSRPESKLKEDRFSKLALDTVAKLFSLKIKEEYRWRKRYGKYLAHAQRVVDWEVQPGTEVRHIDLLDCIACYLYSERRFTESEVIRCREYETSRTLLGEEHSTTAVTLANLGRIYLWRGKYREAEATLTKCLTLSQDKADGSLLQICYLRYDLAKCHLKRGEYDTAIELIQKAQTELGVSYDNTELSRGERKFVVVAEVLLGWLYAQCGKLDEAESTITRGLENSIAAFGKDSKSSTKAMERLAWVRLYQKRYEAAGEVFMDILDIMRQRYGEEHGDTLRAMSNLGNLWSVQRRWSKALPMLEETLEIQSRILGPHHEDTAYTLEKVQRAKREKAEDETSKTRRRSGTPLQANGAKRGLRTSVRMVLRDKLSFRRHT